MNYKILSLKDIKKIIDEYEFEKYPHLNKFKENPYSFLKAKYYTYCSVVLIYALLKTRISPNMVTISYALCGFVGAIFLSIPNTLYNIIGILIFFNKGILDWSDGKLARIKYEPSLTGHILDVYGATLNSIGLTIGLGFFAMNQTNYDFLIYLIVVVTFLHSEVYTSAGKKIILENLSSILNQNQIKKRKEMENIKIKKNSNEIQIKYPKWLQKFKGILDDNARSVDLILLFILIDILTSFNFSLYIFLLLFLKNLLRFFLSLIYGVRSKWAENFVNDLKINNNSKYND